jgi:hypothetical protein
VRRNAALLLAETVVLLVLLEVAVRLVVSAQIDVPHMRVFPEGYYTWDPGARFTFHNLPNVVPPSAEIAINELGLRGPSFPHEKPAGEIRVLVLGDSFTAAVQLPRERIFTTLLEEELNRNAPTPRHRVINAGFNGAATAHELLYFQHQGAALAPDVVILQYTFNDIRGNLNHGGFHVVDGRLELSESLRNPPFWRGPLLALRDGIGNRSLAFFLLYRLLQGGGATMSGSAHAAAPPAPSPRPGAVLTERLAAEVIASAARIGAPVILVTIPSAIGLGGDDEGYNAVVEAFRSLVARDGNQLVVADTILRDAERRGEHVYLDFDGHLSERGHALLAPVLAEAVRTSLRH